MFSEPTPAEMRKIHSTSLIDFGQQGGMSKMKEAPGINVLVKEIPIHNISDIDDAINESYMGGKLSHLRYVRGVETHKTAGDLQRGDAKIQFFIKKVEGKPVVIPTDHTKLIDFGVEMSNKLAEIAKEGVVLEDFKPQNIVHDNTEHILIDLGVSVRKDLPPSGVTFEYTSPDVLDAQGQPAGLDSRHDTYCLASVMAEAILGKTPNQLYEQLQGDILTLSPNERQKVHQQIKSQLLKRCHPNVRLAEVLAEALEPDRDNRPSISKFAARMEEISARFMAFGTISEHEINEVRTIEDFGILLGKLKKGMIFKRTDIPVNQQQVGEYMENTNFDIIGKIAHATANVRSNPYGMNPLDALKRVFKDLEDSLQYGDAPHFMKKPEEKFSTRMMTPREREAVHMVLTLRNLAKRFLTEQDVLIPEGFVRLALTLLRYEDPQKFEENVIESAHAFTKRELREMVKGYMRVQNPQNHTPLPKI
ncbi:MAG: hypothetical protein ABIO02_03720 [Patescibacteria group bacterium]